VQVTATQEPPRDAVAVEGVEPPAAGARVRVLHLGPEPSPRGGIGLSIQRLIGSPLSERHEMTALPTWRYNTGRVRQQMVFAAALLRTCRWCLGRGPRIVHVHTSVRGSWYRKGIFVVVAKLLRRPVVLQFRSGVGDLTNFVERVGPLRRLWFRLLFRLPDRVLSVSKSGAEEVARRWRPGDVHVVTNPAPPIGPPRPPSRDPGPAELLFIGGFANPTKGAHVLYAALTTVLAGADRRLAVTLAGAGEPSPEFQRWIDEHPGMRWVGWLDPEPKARALERADVFVLPSFSEGMPNAMLEAMAQGCAVIASSVGAVPEVVTDGVDGLLVPPGDPAALARAIEAMAADRSLRERLGRAGQERVGRLARDEVYARLEAIYLDLAVRRAGDRA
jgi:glycosyltransferase involved in cell wall biosynthesis